MLTIDEFPHHNARYSNDEYQANLITMLLSGFVTTLAIIALWLVIAST